MSVYRRLKGVAAASAVMLALTLTGCASTSSPQPEASGDNVESVDFGGNVLTFVVSTGAGGSLDVIARTLAPYVADELGVRVVVENDPGAGGTLAANKLYSQTGSKNRIGFFAGQGMVGATIAEADGIQFSMEDFTPISILSETPRLIVAAGNSDYQSIEDVLAGSDVRFATSGPGGGPQIDATILLSTLGFDGRIVSGFSGGAESRLAAEAGDVDLLSFPIEDVVSDVKNGELIGLLVIGQNPHPELPDVPLVTDLDLSASDREIIDAHIAMQQMGRIVMAPPGMPEANIAAIENAIINAAANPDFISAIAQYSGEIVNPTSSADARSRILARIENAPVGYVDLLKAAY